MFFSQLQKRNFVFDGNIFSYGYIYKKILNLDGLKCELKSVYAADFTKQSIKHPRSCRDKIQVLEQNEALVETTKLPHLILCLRATFTFYEKLSSSLKCVNYYMIYSQSEEWFK